MNANIVEIKRFAVHDGDGIRTTVFFKGCPLKCLWCHNPETLSSKRQLAFYGHKCIGCKKCAEVCDCHTFSENMHIKALMADLKRVYAAVDEQTELSELDSFDEKWSSKYPKIAISWRAN